MGYALKNIPVEKPDLDSRKYNRGSDSTGKRDKALMD